MDHTRRTRRPAALVPYLPGPLVLLFLAVLGGCDSSEEIDDVEALEVAATMAKASMDALGRLLDVDPPPEQCPEGGVVDSVCDGRRDISVFSLNFDACEPMDPAPDVSPSINGTVEITVDQPTACESMNRVGTEETIFFYRELSVTSAGASREVVERQHFDGLVVSDELAPSAEALVYSGSFDFFSDGQGVDITTAAIDLSLLLDPAMGGGDQITAVSGRLEVAQMATGVTITQDYDNFVLIQSVDMMTGDRTVTLQGNATTDCLGPVTYTTVDPVVFLAGQSCPSSGLLEVVQGSQTSLVRFTSSGGVELDRGGDGTVDKVFSSCSDLRVRQTCR
ncbi:MAG: hypothetical protein O7J95_06000 [Planctomycetota bacterium]|nr:hypothetical protein [Planctomycetota bacterium]